MSELPAISGKVAVKLFESFGFNVVRIRGSHHIMKKDGHRFLLSVPVHGNQSLKRGTLGGILTAAAVTEAEAIERLKLL